MEAAEFDQLVELHADAVRGFIWRRAGGLDPGVSDPADINAEVWAIAWQRRAAAPSVEASQAGRAWLLQIARYCVANHIRKTVHRRETDRLLRPAEVTAASAESVAVADLELAQALSSLSTAEREVFAMSVWDGLSPKQIAQVTQSSSNAVSIRLHRAKKKLQGALVERTSAVSTPTTQGIE